MSTQRKLLLIFCLLPVAITGIAMLLLPGTVALHYGFTFQADTYGSKYLLMIPAMLLFAMNLLLFFFFRREEKQWNSELETTAQKKRATTAIYYAGVLFCDIILIVFTAISA
ncbi:MAG: DUF1648 domain-containing protein [Oscillospiraceae bacterium]|jgi:Zn-dependent protease with chaperone function|nr:DUF1648 domain-containing protein [Oscillospiraceae bacterium]